MTLELREGDFEAFFEAPLNAYGRNSLYITPMRSDLKRYLDPKRNPLMAQNGGALRSFTAHRGGRAIGRITAHIHPASNQRLGFKRAHFGFFDCADDPEAARALLERAERFGREHGCHEIAGNFNLTAMQQIGVMTDGFENPPYTDMIWGAPHLPRLLEAAGYQSFFPVSTFEFDLSRDVPPALLGAKQQDVLASPDWTWRPIRRSTFAARMEEARRLLNDGFLDNPMFVPLTREEFQFQAGEMMWIIDPRLSTIAAYKDEPAGAIVCVPDLNPFVKAIGGRIGPGAVLQFIRRRMRRRRAVLIFYSVRRDLHDLGLNGAMLYRTLSALKAAGYRTCGGTWISDENGASLRQVEKLGARRLHRLSLFRKPLV